MISKAELVAISRESGVPLGTVEKDYILTAVLKAVSESGFVDVLIFKGGTALHKFYLHKRFSVDLDFTSLKPVKLHDLREIIEIPDVQTKVKKFAEYDDALTIKQLGYLGPLNYPNSIKLDISFREKPILAPVSKPYESPFFDGFSLLTLQPEELVAEKLRAVHMRKEPRDYLDLYLAFELLSLDANLVRELSVEKLHTVGGKLNSSEIFTKSERLRALWDQELREVIPQSPDFDRVILGLKKRLQFLEA